MPPFMNRASEYLFKAYEHPYLIACKELGFDFEKSYKEGKMPFFKGDILIQPWAPVISSELRVLVVDPKYNNTSNTNNKSTSNTNNKSKESGESKEKEKKKPSDKSSSTNSSNTKDTYRDADLDRVIEFYDILDIRQRMLFYNIFRCFIPTKGFDKSYTKYGYDACNDCALEIAILNDLCVKRDQDFKDLCKFIDDITGYKITGNNKCPRHGHLFKYDGISFDFDVEYVNYKVNIAK
jgi:hypothetical protein